MTILSFGTGMANAFWLASIGRKTVQVQRVLTGWTMGGFRYGNCVIVIKSSSENAAAGASPGPGSGDAAPEQAFTASAPNDETNPIAPAASR